MTIADSTRSQTGTNEPQPVIRLGWRVAPRLEDAPSEPTDLRPLTGSRLVLSIEPGALPDTGIARAWLETEAEDRAVLGPLHVDLQRVQAQGWTHLEVEAPDGPLVSLSLLEGQLRYLLTDLPVRAGLPGGTYEAATYEERIEDDEPEAAPDGLEPKA